MGATLVAPGAALVAPGAAAAYGPSNVAPSAAALHYPRAQAKRPVPRKGHHKPAAAEPVDLGGAMGPNPNLLLYLLTVFHSQL